MFNGIQEWISFGFFALIILGYVVRIFRQALTRQNPGPGNGGQQPVEAEAPRPPRAGAGAGQGTKDIRQFLDEIRRGIEETRAPQPQPAPEAQISSREVARSAPVQPPPLPVEPQQGGATQPRREAKKRRRQERQAPNPAAPPQQSTHDYLEELHAGTDLPPGISETGAQRSFEPGKQSRIHRLNVSLRDAILAEVILGLPRSRGTGGTSRGNLGAGRRLRTPRQRPQQLKK